MNSVTETKPKRQNRTVTVYLCNTLAEYQEMIATQQGIQELIWRVEIGDSLNWGHLADGRKAGCPRQLHFTHHDSYTRWAEPFDGTRSSVSMLRVRCLDCEAVFTIQPAFIVRYKRYDTDAMAKFATLLFITEDGYRRAGISQALGRDTRQAGTCSVGRGSASNHLADGLKAFLCVLMLLRLKHTRRLWTSCRTLSNTRP